MVGGVIYFSWFYASFLDSKEYKMKEVISLSILFIPLIWEIIDDYRVEKNHKVDVFVRAVLMLVCALWPWFHGHSYFASVALSFSIFFLLFDYSINIIMLRRKDFFSFLGTTSTVDKIKWWHNMKPWNRFYIRAIVFVLSLSGYLLLH